MKRIVIADDSATARMVIRRCLEIIGLGDAVMVEVPNGREALARLKEEPADLLVTDLNMPIMDGETLLKWVKGSPKLTTVPVVVITSAGNPAKSALLTELGAFAVLDKPISPATLLKQLGSLIQ